MDLFGDTAAILNSIISNSYYGMFRGQISMRPILSKHEIMYGVLNSFCLTLNHLIFIGK